MASFSDESWSTPESDLTAEQFCSVCLIDLNSGGEKVKSACKLPIRKRPGGAVSKAALRNAASRIFQMSGVPPDKKRAAARKLVSLMGQAGIEVTSGALLKLAGRRAK
jgi:hypothetical protein